MWRNKIIYILVGLRVRNIFNIQFGFKVLQMYVCTCMLVCTMKCPWHLLSLSLSLSESAWMRPWVSHVTVPQDRARGGSQAVWTVAEIWWQPLRAGAAKHRPAAEKRSNRTRYTLLVSRLTFLRSDETRIQAQLIRLQERERVNSHPLPFSL